MHLLLELSTVLLLETADLVHVDRVELSLGLLLVGGELLVVHGLKTDSRVVANPDNENTTALWSALVVLLIREGDVDLGNIVGRVGRRVGVGKHGVAVLVDDKDAGAAIVRRLDGEASVVGHALGVAVIVRGETILLVVDKLHLLLATSAAEQEEDRDQDQAEEDQAEKSEHHVDQGVVRAIRVRGCGGGPGKEVVKGRHRE